MITITQAIKSTDTEINLSTTFTLTATGNLSLGNSEVVSYSGKTGNKVTGVTRAVSGQAGTHAVGTIVELVVAP